MDTCCKAFSSRDNLREGFWYGNISSDWLHGRGILAPTLNGAPNFSFFWGSRFACLGRREREGGNYCIRA